MTRRFKQAGINDVFVVKCLSLANCFLCVDAMKISRRSKKQKHFFISFRSDRSLSVSLLSNPSTLRFSLSLSLSPTPKLPASLSLSLSLYRSLSLFLSFFLFLTIFPPHINVFFFLVLKNNSKTMRHCLLRRRRHRGAQQQQQQQRDRQRQRCWLRRGGAR